MASRRQRKVAELIHRELGVLLLREVRDPRLAGITITEVRVTPDLLQARIFYTVLGDEEEKKEAQKGLQSAGAYLRSALAERVQLRLAPELIFEPDTSSEYGRRIDTLLDEIAQESPPEDE